VLTIDQVDRDSADAVGSKMANLGELRNRVGLRVSNGFAVTAEEGVWRMEDVGDLSGFASLTDEQALQIAGIALQLEDYYGAPQDVE